MALYIVEKDNTRFYIQPEMISDYANMGYAIIKLEEQVVEDVQAEVQMISEMENI